MCLISSLDLLNVQRASIAVESVTKRIAMPALSRDYFERIDAPLRGFYLFSNSAHSPLFEEPDRAIAVLLEDVMHGRTEHADIAEHRGGSAE